MRAPLAKCYRRGAHPVRLPPERRVRPQELALLQVRAPREGLPPPRPDPFARARVTPEVRPCERVSNRRVWSGCGGQALGARASAKLVALRRPCGHCAGARRRASPVSFRGAKQGSTSHSGVPALCLTSYTAQLLHSSGAHTHPLRTCPPLPPPPHIVHVVQHAPPPPAHPTVVPQLLRASQQTRSARCATSVALAVCGSASWCSSCTWSL